MKSFYETLRRAPVANGQGSLGVAMPRDGEPVQAARIPSDQPRADIESMTALFGAIQPFLESKPGAVLHVVAATAEEGASTVAAGLALMIATTGHRRTLLLDADQHSLQTARAFQCQTTFGLIDYIRRQADYTEALYAIPESLLTVGCLIGQSSPTPLDIETIRSLYKDLHDRFDVTVIDCPSVEGGGYSYLIPEASDGIILVVQAEKTRPAIVEHAKNLIQKAGGNIIGAVLNRRKDYIPKFFYKSL